MITVKEALDLSAEELQKRRSSPLDFKRGWNDCWAFLCLYENYLKEGEGKLLPLSFSFSSFPSFLREMKRKGYNSLEELANIAGYRSVKDKPIEGDVCFSKPYCLSIYDGSYWYSPQERSTILTKNRTVLYPIYNFRMKD